MGLFQGISLDGMTGSVSLIVTSQWVSTSPIMATHWTSASLMSPAAWVSFWHVAMSVQGGLSHEQLLQGCIHLPMQLKHLIRQVSLFGPGGAQDCGLWGNTAHIKSFQHGMWRA